MPFTMQGSMELDCSVEQAWSALNDEQVLKRCIPGCQALERSGENAFEATVQVKIGPISAKFKGAVELTDLDPPHAYRISGQGSGGVAGSVKGGAFVKLEQTPSGCLLTYTVEATIGGKIAQLGSRLIDGVAKKQADLFFGEFRQAIEISPAA